MRSLVVSVLLAGCAPLADPRVRFVAIDLVSALPTEPGPELDGLDLDALAASTGRIEARPPLGEAQVTTVGLPRAPEGTAFYGVLGFVPGEREGIVGGHDVEVGPDRFAWDAVLGPLHEDEDGAGLLFFDAAVAPFELGALRTALVVASSSADPGADSATIVLAGAFEFVDTAAEAGGHSHGP